MAERIVTTYMKTRDSGVFSSVCVCVCVCAYMHVNVPDKTSQSYIRWIIKILDFHNAACAK